MPKKKPFAKIAITLPPDDLAAADRLAAEQDRSRSWIIAEALRQYVARSTPTDATPPLDPSRREQLRRDMALTPAERLLHAEASVHVVGGPAGGTASPKPLTFQSYDDFLAWQRARATPQ